MYSVTQSYANTFLGDVVLDTFNDESRDEDKILSQIYIRTNMLGFLLWGFKILRVIEENAYLKKYSIHILQGRAHKIGF